MAKTRLWRVKGYPGAIHNRGGMCRFRWNRREWSPRIPFDPVRRQDAEVAYVKWYRVQAGYDRPETLRAAPMTLVEAIQRFEEERYPAMTRRTQALYRTVFGHYDGSNVPLSIDAIYDLMRRHDELDRAGRIKRATRKSYLVQFRAFLIYAIDRQWLRDRDGRRPERNPADMLLEVDPMPRRRRLRGVVPETLDILRIASRMWDRHEPDYAISTILLALSGMRSAELQHALKEDIHDDGMLIIGKGSLAKIEGMSLEERRLYVTSHADEVITRWIPFNLLPGVRECVQFLMDYTPREAQRRQRGADYLVCMASMHVLRRRFRECRDAEGVSSQHSLHSLRRYAIDTWKHIYGWPRDLRADVAGHDEDMAETVYEQASNPAQLLQRAQRAGVAVGAAVGQQ